MLALVSVMFYLVLLDLTEAAVLNRPRRIQFSVKKAVLALIPIGVRAGGAGGAAAPPVSKIFGQNAKNSGNKETINDGIEK